MKTAAIFAAVALAAAAPTLVIAQQQPRVAKEGTRAKAPGKMAAVNTMQIVATVEAIDAANRTVTLKGPKGYVETVGLSDDVRNLRQVKVGDRVVVTYAQARALDLKKSGADIRERAGSEGRMRAVPGERPAGVGREIFVVAEVVAVNYNRQTVTLRGPNQTVTLAVGDGVLLKSITTGDQVQAIYTEALAVAVRAAPKGDD